MVCVEVWLLAEKSPDYTEAVGDSGKAFKKFTTSVCSNRAASSSGVWSHLQIQNSIIITM